MVGHAKSALLVKDDVDGSMLTGKKRSTFLESSIVRTGAGLFKVDSGPMRIGLEGTSARWLFLSVVLVVVAGLVLPAGKVWLAAHCNLSPSPQQWQKAVELEPGNESYWLHLGVYHQENLLHPDERRALVEFRRAAQANPHSDEAWLYIARASEDAGDVAAARSAYERAQACHPISAEVAWRYGSFLIRQADIPAAYTQIRRAIRENPSLTPAAIAEYWEAGRGPEEILEQLLPAQPDVGFTALNFFVSQHQTAPALLVWNRILELHQPLRMQQALPLVDELIRQNQTGDAVRSWRAGLRASAWPVEEQPGGTLIFDGGFEHDLLNGGFAWREIRVDGVHYAFDNGVAHSGARSLRVEFDGSANLDFAQVLQYVAVEPLRRYRFAAFLRTEAVSTESGVRFEIEDARRPGALTLFTPNLTGTNPWTEAELVFQTGRQTDLLLLSLRRTPSRKLDNKLSGTVWVDDVSLVPVRNDGDAAP
jgi:tetratricopeptide (TPR) repeat protein